MTLSWTDSSNDETGFKIYRKLSNESDYSLLETVTGVNTYADSTVTGALTAYYKVTSYNDNGESAESKIVSSVADYTAPSVSSVSPVANSSINQSAFTDPPAPGTLPVVLSFSEPVTTFAHCALNSACESGTIFSLTVNGIASPDKLRLPMELKTLGNTVQANLHYVAGATYVLTLHKGYIRDANGLSMKEDFSVTLTTP